MKNVARIVSALFAIAAGAVTGCSRVRLPAVHQLAGRIFQRGELIALVRQVESSRRILEHVSERNNFAQEEKISMKLTRREELIAGEALPTNAVTTNESERALVAWRNQFADDRQFRIALQHSGVSQRTLRRTLAEAIRGEAWI